MILQNSAVLWGTLNFVNLIIFDSEDVVLIETEIFKMTWILNGFLSRPFSFVIGKCCLLLENFIF